LKAIVNYRILCYNKKRYDTVFIQRFCVVSGWKEVDIFTFLVSAAVSAGIVLLFRQLDKDNNSLGKVRQYADKRRDEFDAYFKEQSKQLSVAKADLDTGQTQAVAAVNRLEKQLAEFKQMIGSLEKDSNSVKNIEEKIHIYDTSISTLMEMTSRVEENLEKIKKEAGIIDQLNQRIESQKKAVDIIEKKLPEVSAGFMLRNTEELKSVGADLLKQYEDRAQQLDKTTQTAIRQNEEVLAKINKSISDAYDNAARKADQLEDDAFTHLDEKAKQRCDSYMHTTEEQLDSLQNELKSRIENCDAELSELISKTGQTADAVEKESAQNSDAIETLHAALEQQIIELQDRYSKLFETAVNDADAKESAAYEKYNAIAQQHVESYKAAVEEKLRNMQDSVKQTITGLQEQTAAAEKNATDTITRLNEMCTAALQKSDAASSEFSEKTAAVTDRIDAFCKETQQKIAAVEQSIADFSEKIAGVFDNRQTDMLADLDVQLAAYKKDIEYRLSQLATAGSDAESLEKALVQAMEQSKKQVLADFQQFSDSQQKSQHDFQESAMKNSADIAEQLAQLEKNMEELKTAAVGGITEKLKDFEEHFDADIKLRGDRISDDLNTWKQAFDNKLNGFTGDYETERRSLEVQYTEAMKQKVAALQKKGSEQMAAFESELQTTRAGIQTQVESIKNDLQTFITQYHEDLQKTTDESGKFLKDASAAYSAKITDQLEKLENELLDGLKLFEDGVTTRQQTSTSTIDAALSEFNTWKQHLKQQFDESRALFDGQLEDMKQSVVKKMEEAKTALGQNISNYTAEAQKQMEEISSEIEELKGKSDQSIGEYQSRSQQILAELQKMYEDMLQTTQERVRTQNADTEQHLHELKTELQTVSDDNRTRQANMVMKMQNDANDIQSRMSELGKELKAVSSQMQLYDKAEQMKKQLDDKIASIQEDFEKLENYRSATEKMSSEFVQLQKIDSEVSEKLAKFQMGKKQIDSMELDFDHLVTLSGGMDEKIKQLQTTSDDLQELQVTVRKFQDTLGGISAHYDRLEKKNEVIDRVAADVDKSFENLRTLEDRLQNCARQADSLPVQLSDIQKNVDMLMSNSNRINDAVAKMESLQNILTETDNRIDAIKSERDGIGRSETRLSKLSKDIDDKFNLLAQITKKDIEKNPGKPAQGISPQDREDIKRLKRQGWTVAAIAKAMKRTETEIELMLELPDN
jgi:chromosome segregation ATPase